MKKILVVLLLGLWLSACGSGTDTLDDSNQEPNNDPREEESSGENDGGESGNGDSETDLNLYTLVEELNGRLDAPSVAHQDHYITLEQAASLTVILKHGDGIDFDFAIFDHNDNQISYSYSPQLTTTLKEYLVPNTYRVRVYTELDATGDYNLTLSARGLSYDGNDTWSESYELSGIKQDELAPYSSGTLDLLDFYTFTLNEDSNIIVDVDKADDTVRYQLRLFNANKTLLASDISSIYDLSVGGGLFAGQYYVVIDGIEASTFDFYNIEMTSSSLEVDEQSTVANPVDLAVDEWVGGSLNQDHDPEDVYRLVVTSAGTYMLELSIDDSLTDGEYRIMVYDENQVLVSEGNVNQPNFVELDVATYFIKVEMLKGVGVCYFIARYWE